MEVQSEKFTDFIVICLVPKIKNSHMSLAKAVQTEAVKTIIADFINPFAFKYRASKKDEPGCKYKDKCYNTAGLHSGNIVCMTTHLNDCEEKP